MLPGVLIFTCLASSGSDYGGSSPNKGGLTSPSVKASVLAAASRTEVSGEEMGSWAGIWGLLLVWWWLQWQWSYNMGNLLGFW